MKILAISSYTREVNWELLTGTLKEEAHKAYRLYLEGIVREIYFTDKDDAVLIMECPTKSEAEMILAELPLVKEKIIEFKVSELKPYTGFSKLMDPEKQDL